MSKTDIIILIFVCLFVAFRLYQKIRKKGPGADGPVNDSGRSPADTTGDDYEPYSGKKE